MVVPRVAPYPWSPTDCSDSLPASPLRRLDRPDATPGELTWNLERVRDLSPCGGILPAY